MRLVVVYRSQTPPVIAMQLDALGWMDASAECRGLAVEDVRTKKKKRNESRGREVSVRAISI